MSEPSTSPDDGTCSVAIARLLLSVAADSGSDSRSLARAARLPRWILAADQAMIPSRQITRLWELTASTMPDRVLPLLSADRLRADQLGLYGYLFSTAATLGQGLQACAGFAHLVSTCSTIRVEALDGITSFSVQQHVTGSPGAQLGQEFCVASLLTLARTGTAREISPVGVGLARRPPRSRQAFTAAFGTRRIDFEMPASSIAFWSYDLELPLLSADPALARLLRRYAASLPSTSSAGFAERVQVLLAEQIEHGTPSLDALARRMAISPRTLQRRFAERGTSWRAELDAARQRRASLPGSPENGDLGGLARWLGYSDPRSARRALSRWDDNSSN